MEIFLISFLVIVLASLGMALGVIAGRTPISAGCGSFDRLGDKTANCDICGSGCEEGRNRHEAIGDRE
jgi:hypothetical protein